MIDYVKVRPNQPGLASQLRSDSRLQWTDQLNSNRQKTGVKATFHALTWYVANSGFVEVTGSLHKCWNSINGRPAENWNNFRRLDLFDLLNWLANEFGVDLTTTTVHNIEFGVNLILPPAPPTVREILSRLLFYGSAKPFTERPVKRGYYKRLDRSDFYVKAYDKGAQYDTPDQRLRFEKGVTAMKNLNDHSPVVVTLADLNQPARLDQLGVLLLDTFDRCFWVEDFTAVPLTATQQKTVTQAHNVAHVAGLTHTQRTRLKDAYNQLANRLDHRLSTDLRAQIETKWCDLLEADCKVLQRGGLQGFTRLENVVKPYIDHPQHQPNGKAIPTDKNTVNTTLAGVVNALDQPDDKATKPGNNCEVAAGNNKKESRETALLRCLVTSLPIHRPRPRQRYLSRLNVRWLHEHDRPTFEVLAGQYLTPKKAGANLDKRCESIAHNIRNSYTNPRNNPVRPLKKYAEVKAGQTLPLFPPTETVRPTDRQRAALDLRRGTRWEIRL